MRLFTFYCSVWLLRTTARWIWLISNLNLKLNFLFCFSFYVSLFCYSVVQFRRLAGNKIDTCVNYVHYTNNKPFVKLTNTSLLQNCHIVLMLPSSVFLNLLLLLFLLAVSATVTAYTHSLFVCMHVASIAVFFSLHSVICQMSKLSYAERSPSNVMPKCQTGFSIFDVRKITYFIWNMKNCDSFTYKATGNFPFK